ncbi:MAG: hypothetical protein SW833_02455 [Cyanobacteriota bacterium]|nr:hypothetical protein [Cyanobacteriota bacterium]
MNVLRVAPHKTPTVSMSNPTCLLPKGAFPRANQWVRLLELPHPLSYDEALLLCQQSEEEWVVWIPDCGEAILKTTQFC